MRLLITGGRGMVGRNLVEALQVAHDVLAPSRSELDLLDFGAVVDYLKQSNVDFIIHAAGRVGGIEVNRRNNSDFLFENAVMGLNLVRAADHHGVEDLLNLSSSCTYPADRDRAIREDELLTGALEPTNEGYAIGKIAVQRMCHMLSLERGHRAYKTAVPCNLYGPYDKFDPVGGHMIPSAIRKVVEAVEAGLNDVEIWGDGTARREFMYVGDLVSFVSDALNRWDSLPATVNVGLGVDHTIREYYDAVAGVVGYRGRFLYDLERPVGMKRKLLDCSQVHSWGWRAQHTLEEGLSATYDYYARTRRTELPAGDQLLG